MTTLRECPRCGFIHEYPCRWECDCCDAIFAADLKTPAPIGGDDNMSITIEELTRQLQAARQNEQRLRAAAAESAKNYTTAQSKVVKLHIEITARDERLRAAHEVIDQIEDLISEFRGYVTGNPR